MLEHFIIPNLIFIYPPSPHVTSTTHNSFSQRYTTDWYTHKTSNRMRASVFHYRNGPTIFIVYIRISCRWIRAECAKSTYLNRSTSFIGRFRLYLIDICSDINSFHSKIMSLSDKVNRNRKYKTKIDWTLRLSLLKFFIKS